MRPADLGIAVPRGWRRSADPAHGLLLAARASVLPKSGFRPTLTLRCEPVTGDRAAWRDAALREAAESLPAFEVEDADEFELAGRDVSYRRYAHAAGSADVICEEWAWQLDGLGVVLTGAVAREDYPDHCDLFEAVAEAFDPGSGSAVA
ncbi:hypothetical protein ACT8ZV_08335 [Nocardioides sp. MAHUQ-72]|uniref:hypothetical protein n=1 Tax=unclassified Nocardioides TaxID=2615069 RepID=UPI00361A1924